MNARYDSYQRQVANIQPAYRKPLDSPYHISNSLYHVLRKVLHDVGGQPDVPVPYESKEETERPWEMNTYVTCECLGWRGVWNSEMRRRMENDLGATQYFGLPYYARWATIAARTLIDHGIITTDELGAKIDEVRTRLRGEQP
jgi:thiocyanate hydrolase subunit beta